MHVHGDIYGSLTEGVVDLKVMAIRRGGVGRPVPVGGLFDDLEVAPRAAGRREDEDQSNDTSEWQHHGGTRITPCIMHVVYILRFTSNFRKVYSVSCIRFTSNFRKNIKSGEEATKE